MTAKPRATDPIEEVLEEMTEYHEPLQGLTRRVCAMDRDTYPCPTVRLIAALRVMRDAARSTVEHITDTERCTSPRSCALEAMTGDGKDFEGDATGWDAAILAALKGEPHAD